jgi:isoleucyl-tRNA synthetase
VLTRLAAPLLPLTTEAVYRGLTGERSVHLADWPDPADLPADAELVASMDSVREVCSAASALRKSQGLRVRLPLRSLTVAATDAQRLAPYEDIIRAEVNVRELRLTEPVQGEHGVERRLTVLARKAGPRLGADVQKAIRGSKSGDWSDTDGRVVAGGVELEPGEYTLDVVVADTSGDTGSASAPLGSGSVVLDTTITPELAEEGVVRDLIRVVQQARRDAGLDVSDRIRLGIDGGDDVTDAVAKHRGMLAAETLATVVELGAVPADGCVDAQVGDGLPVRVTVERTG